MKSVSKEIFLKSRSCLTWGWYLRNQEKSAVLSEADRFRMEQGAEVGKIARTLYPEGVLVPPGPREEMCKKTSEFVRDASQNEIFEYLSPICLGRKTAYFILFVDLHACDALFERDAVR